MLQVGDSKWQAATLYSVLNISLRFAFNLARVSFQPGNRSIRGKLRVAVVDDLPINVIVCAYSEWRKAVALFIICFHKLEA